MAGSDWYYSQDDKELGPVSQAQLTQMAKDGRLSASDLVWCHGMDDWIPAGQASGLQATFAKAPAPGRRAAWDSGASGGTVAGRASSVGAEDHGTAAGFGASTGRFLDGLRGDRRQLAQALLIPGIILVLTARGCDGLGRRGAQRQVARYAAATGRFEDSWEWKGILIRQQTDELKQQRKDLQDEFRDRSGIPTAQDREAYNQQLKQIDDDIEAQNVALQALAEEKETQRNRLADGQWREMKIAAREAERNNIMWSYWRELLFVFGSQLLTVGLLLMGFHGQGAERWICLIMLAIITFSLYVGGVAWMSSLPGLGTP